MAWPNTPLQIRTQLLVNGAWVTISNDVYNRQKVVINWGRKDESSKVTHSKCSLQINNRGGQYSDENPYSPYFELLGQNTQIRQSVITPDGTEVYRFHMEVPEWPQRWDVSDTDVYVPIQCAGILRRLGQGTKPLRDALRRHIEAAGPINYWPLTDGEDARHGTEIVRGSQPFRAVGEAGSFYQGQPDWGKGSLAPWLEPVVELPDETIGRLSAYVPAQTLTGWSIDHCFSGGGLGYGNQFEIWDSGPRLDTDNQIQWTITTNVDPGAIRLMITHRGETANSTTFVANVAPADLLNDALHQIRLSVADAGGGNVEWKLYYDGSLEASGTHAATFRPPRNLTYRWGTVEGGGITTNPMGLGHITYWGPNPPSAASTWKAAQGHMRELAGRRIERLCAEHGVPLQVHGNLDHTPQMGPQKAATFLALLDSAAQVDGGVVHEARDDFALAYRTNRSRYNQGV